MTMFYLMYKLPKIIKVKYINSLKGENIMSIKKNTKKYELVQIYSVVQRRHSS